MGNADKQWLDKYQSIGVEPCKTDFTPEQLKLAKVGEKKGMEHLVELAPKMTDARTLLGTRDTLGDAPRDIFAEGTYLGQWGLPPIEASYRKSDFDSTGQKLDGSKHDYVMRFKAPNVSEFWSVTIYGNDNRLMAKKRPEPPQPWRPNHESGQRRLLHHLHECERERPCRRSKLLAST